MRQAQYRLAPVEGDAAEGEVNVFYFGPESGGGTEANLLRWIGQMQLPDGSDPMTAAQRRSFEADGMPAHVVSLDGTYLAGGMRPMGGDEATPRPGYRLVGVVLEGPQGSLFFKLTGPEATARAMEGTSASNSRPNPSQPRAGGRSPTTITPSRAAVAGSPRLRVVAVVDRVVFKPWANRR